MSRPSILVEGPSLRLVAFNSAARRVPSDASVAESLVQALELSAAIIDRPAMDEFRRTLGNNGLAPIVSATTVEQILSIGNPSAVRFTSIRTMRL